MTVIGIIRIHNVGTMDIWTTSMSMCFKLTFILVRLEGHISFGKLKYDGLNRNDGVWF